jgi:hypothetical protein
MNRVARDNLDLTHDENKLHILNAKIKKKNVGTTAIATSTNSNIVPQSQTKKRAAKTRKDTAAPKLKIMKN